MPVPRPSPLNHDWRQLYVLATVSQSVFLCGASLADERLLAQLVQEVRDAFQEESFLFKEA
jgi:hypothetical protein